MKQQLILASIALAASVGASAQYTYTSTSLTFDDTTVYASAYTEADYYTASYYSMGLASYLYAGCDLNCGNGQLLNEETNYGTSSVSYSASVAVADNTWYTLLAFPWLDVYYDYYVDGGYEWIDQYGYSVTSTSDGSPSIYEYPSGTYELTGTQVIETDAGYNTVFATGIPNYMVVTQDYTSAYSGCRTTVARVTTYQVMQASGQNAGTLAICEDVSSTNWNCTQSQPTVGSTPCNGYPAGTDSTSHFTDVWSLNSDNYTPIGCGFNNTTVSWNHPNISGTKTRFGTLNGSMLTNSISINGTTQFTVGSRVNP